MKHGWYGAVQVNIPQKAITARRVVTQLLHSCRRLGDVLVGVLPPREHVRLAAALLQGLAGSIISARHEPSALVVVGKLTVSSKLISQRLRCQALQTHDACWPRTQRGPVC